jgi:hypothetical protein
VTGKPPEEATLRVADDRIAPAISATVANYRAGFLAAIDACLRVKHVERPQSVAQLRPMLLSQEAPAETRRLVETRKIDPAQTAPPAVTLQRVPRLWPIAVAGILVLFGGAYGGIEYARRVAGNQGHQPAEAGRQADAAAARKRADEEGAAKVDRPAAREVATQPAPPVASSPAPATKQDPPSPSPAVDNVTRVPLWAANAADVAAWRLKSTTRLSGALSSTAVSFDRTMVAVTGGREGSLHVIDALTLRPRAKIMLASYTPYSLGGIVIFADNKRLAVVRNGGLEVYDIAG